MDHTHVHAVIELVDKGGKAVDTANSGVNVVAKTIAASHAFRKYDWLRKAPVKNASGNLRGMVVNGNARVVYDFTIKYGSKIERFNTFVTVAVALADSFEQIGDIVQSKDPGGLKCAKLGTQATAIAMNVLTGIVTTPAHAVLMSMQGYCDMADVARGIPVGTCGQTLKAVDAIIESAAKQVSDGNNIYTFVNTTITPRVSKAFGL
ncbi:MAG: hypothetical protein ABSC93_21235 [Bryobacteraceae bacterium]|jgi:hypothetical protein